MNRQEPAPPSQTAGVWSGDVKVSVLVMTYNHARFIRQALDSVLMQETDFAVEILISEDMSTDGTRQIVQEYHRENPDSIRLLLSDRNIRTNAVVSRGIEAARGTYVALLDGDDYWLTPNKLRTQVDYLDAHPECAICFHNSRAVHEDADRDTWNWTRPGHPEKSSLNDLLHGNFISTCSTMFRRGLIDPVPSWYAAFFPITDWPLHILNAEHGEIGYVDEVMGAYRLHKGGCYSPKTQQEKLRMTLDFYQRINACLEYRYDRQIRGAISKYFIEWTDEFVERGDLDAAKACYRMSLRGRPFERRPSWRRIIRTGLRLYSRRRR